jgi:hypothetical protein
LDEILKRIGISDMRIYYSQDTGPMLLETGVNLDLLQGRLSTFLTSEIESDSVPAETAHSPAPYHEFLGGLRIQKTQGQVMLSLAEDRWLELTGSEANLAKYISHFYFWKPEEDAADNQDNAEDIALGSLSLIFEEADSTCAENVAG